jgi:ubiquinone biosynthesis protein COQ9
MGRNIGDAAAFVQFFRAVSSAPVDFGSRCGHIPDMTQDVQDIRDRILASLLPDLAFDGWTWDGACKASVAAGYDRHMATAVFPGGLGDVLDHFSGWADRQMLERLKKTDPGSMRVRDRVRMAVAERFAVLAPWKEAVRMASRYWAVPYRAAHAGRLVWRTADCIWIWAGDTATDYNRLTKRTLLAGVLSSTMLVWLADQDAGLERTNAFLDRRIENVMRLGQFIGKIKKPAFVRPGASPAGKRRGARSDL